MTERTNEAALWPTAHQAIMAGQSPEIPGSAPDYRALHRDLVSRLGFGDNITEPMADNNTIVAWFEDRCREADEWREHERFRDECALAGHDPLNDCDEHGPACCHRAHLVTPPASPTQPADSQEPGA